MDYGYPNHSGIEEKKSIEEIEATYKCGLIKPLLDIEELCYSLNVPYDEVVFSLLKDHIFTIDIDNDFFNNFRIYKDVDTCQMTDYEGFKLIVRYAQAREKHLEELTQCFLKDIKGEN